MFSKTMFSKSESVRDLVYQEEAKENCYKYISNRLAWAIWEFLRRKFVTSLFFADTEYNHESLFNVR